MGFHHGAHIKNFQGLVERHLTDKNATVFLQLHQAEPNREARRNRAILSQIRELRGLDDKHMEKKAVELRVPTELVAWVAQHQKLPVPNFSAGGVATPADAALMMQLGAEAVFVGSGIFKSGDPVKRAKAIVRATTHYMDPKVLIEVSRGLGEPMVGIDIHEMPAHERYASRGV